MDFAIAPDTFLRCAWIIILCTFGVGAAALTLVRVRILGLTLNHRQSAEERTAERERIARELHDTLIQSTQALVLTVQMATARVSRDDPLRAMLERALDHADALIAEGRDRIQDLRRPAEAADDLPRFLATVGERLARDGAVKFRASVEGPACALETGALHESHAICREAMMNAFRHADAGSIEVRIVYGRCELQVFVRDDGRGMNTDLLDLQQAHGCWGLKGMYERARMIGAAFDIASWPGKGATVSLKIPARTAYARSRSRFPWTSPWRLSCRGRRAPGV